MRSGAIGLPSGVTACEFEAHFSRQVTANFDAGTLTTDGGGLLLRQTERRIGLLKRLAGCFTDWRRADRVEQRLDEMLAQRIYGLALGYETPRVQSSASAACPRLRITKSSA